MKKLSSSQLYDLWQKRIIEEKQEESLKNSTELLNLVNFLRGKKYLKETCINPAVTYYYECDASHEPKVKEDKWANIKNYLTIRVVKQLDPLINDLQCTIECSYLDNTSWRDKSKHFHFNNLSSLSEITEHEFVRIKEAFTNVSNILLNI